MTSENGAWPITNDELLERLRLDDDGFADMYRTFGASLGRRAFDAEAHERALGYPWDRPTGSFVLRGDAVEPYDHDLTEGRHALLAVGSNAAPWRLTGKLAHFEDPDDRLVPVECGVVEDFDVGAMAHPTTYGALAATPFESSGARVRLHVLWVNDTQLTLLTWSEVSYRFGRLDDVVFEGTPRRLYAYASRFGLFAPDGEPVALAAVPAERRTAPALTQRELLDRAGKIVLGADGEALVRAVFEDYTQLLPLTHERLKPYSKPFDSERWTPLT